MVRAMILAALACGPAFAIDEKLPKRDGAKPAPPKAPDVLPAPPPAPPMPKPPDRDLPKPPPKPPAPPAAGAGLGLTYEPVPEALRAQLGLGADKGLLVAAVRPGGAGDKAGVKKFDVLVEVDGQPINAQATLAKLLAGRKPGDPAKLRVLSGGRMADLDANLGAPDVAGPQLARDDEDKPLPRGRREFPGMPPGVVLGGDLGAMPDLGALRDAQRQAMEDMQRQLAEARRQFAMPPGAGGGITVSSSQMETVHDDSGDYTITTTRSNQRRRLTIKGQDADGKPLAFDKSGTSAAIKQALEDSKLPEAVRAKALAKVGG